VDDQHRGLASGLKGFMDITGAMLGFLSLGQLLGAGSSFLAIGAIAIALIGTYFVGTWLTPEDHPGNSTTVRANTIALGRVFSLDLSRHATFVRLVIARFLFLLGIYATGRFLDFFVADRLNLPAEQAAQQAGTLLAGLALITILASPITGWLADRMGRTPLIVAGAILGALSALLLIWTKSPSQILFFGGFMSLGSAAFAGGSWALLADLVPKEESARYFGLANFSTAGSAAVAGLFGPLIDWVERQFPGEGFSILFVVASIAFIASVLPVKGMFMKEFRDVREKNRDKRKAGADGGRLVVLPLSADSAAVKEDQNP